MGDDHYPITIRVSDERKDEWEKSMEELGMGSMAEYIRATVAAGRKQYEGIAEFDGSDGDSIQKRIKRELDNDSYTSWDELIAGLADDLEVEAETALEQMEGGGKVDHSPREGGWRLNER